MNLCWKYTIQKFYFGTNTKSTNLRIHELVIFNQTTKIDTHEVRYVHSIVNCLKCSEKYEQWCRPSGFNLNPWWRYVNIKENYIWHRLIKVIYHGRERCYNNCLQSSVASFSTLTLVLNCLLTVDEWWWLFLVDKYYISSPFLC